MLDVSTWVELLWEVHGAIQKSHGMVHRRVMDSLKLSRDTQVRLTVVARPVLTPVAQKLYWCERDVFTREHYFARKSFTVVLEEFGSACPDRGLVTEFLDSGCVCVSGVHRATKQLKLRSYRLEAVHQLLQRDSSAGIQYCHCFVVLYVVTGWVLNVKFFLCTQTQNSVPLCVWKQTSSS
jgi:hypothetical protein